MYGELYFGVRVSVAPGHLFSADRRFRHHLRLNYGHPEPQQLEAAFRTLGRLAARLRTA